MGSSLTSTAGFSPLLPDLLLVTLAVLDTLPDCLGRRAKVGIRFPKLLAGVFRGEVEELISPDPLSTDYGIRQL